MIFYQLQSEFDTYKFSDYKGKNCELLVILPEHFPSKIVYEMAHLLEKKFVISTSKFTDILHIEVLNQLQSQEQINVVKFCKIFTAH